MSGGAGGGQGGRSALPDDKSVAVVLVSYNSAGVIREAITSVDEDCEVIVVDNASEDDLERVLCGTGVRIIRNAANLGFGTACNIGAQAVAAAFLLFLNPDARLEPGALAKLLARAEADPRLGALNPRIIDGNGNVWQRRHSRLLDKSANDRVKRTLTQDCDIEMLSGAALFCRTDAFEQIGGFDDKIFLFCEDDDLAIRLKAAGYRLGYVHDAVVHHARGGSSASSPALDRFKAYHFMRSGWYGCLKHGLAFNRPYQIALCSWKYALGWVKLDQRQRAKYAGYLKALGEPSPDVDA
jgi:N-acetylglucosaminyl-diphospho-decaprenol L-rhamnosyltransferase